MVFIVKVGKAADTSSIFDRIVPVRNVKKPKSIPIAIILNFFSMPRKN